MSDMLLLFYIRNFVIDFQSAFQNLQQKYNLMLKGLYRIEKILPVSLCITIFFFNICGAILLYISISLLSTSNNFFIVKITFSLRVVFCIDFFTVSDHGLLGIIILTTRNWFLFNKGSAKPNFFQRYFFYADPNLKMQQLRP